jgi:hypothetical protein
MGSSPLNCVAENAIKSELKHAQVVLNNVKRERYTRRKQYRLVKVWDHPLTFKEVLVEDKK